MKWNVIVIIIILSVVLLLSNADEVPLERSPMTNGDRIRTFCPDKIDQILPGFDLKTIDITVVYKLNFTKKFTLFVLLSIS